MKYILLENDTIEFFGRKLFRIQAVRDFGNVKKDDLGGYIEKEANLSHDGNAWISGDAKIWGNAKIYGNVEIWGNAKISGNAKIWGNAKIYGNVEIWGNAWISGDAKIWGNAKIYGNVEIWGNAKISGNAEISGDAKIWGNAKIFGNAKIYGNAEVRGDAEVFDIHDYIVFKNFWSSGRYFTYTKSNKMWAVGCFYGTGEELIEKAYKDSEESGKFYEKYVNFVKELEEMEK